jgi:hypothetical protein
MAVSTSDAESTNIQRAEVVAHSSVDALAVADGKDDRVTLVSPDPLEVLDEGSLRTGLVEDSSR